MSFFEGGFDFCAGNGEGLGAFEGEDGAKNFCGSAEGLGVGGFVSQVGEEMGGEGMGRNVHRHSSECYIKKGCGVLLECP